MCLNYLCLGLKIETPRFLTTKKLLYRKLNKNKMQDKGINIDTNKIIADVIVKVNVLESSIKEIIVSYVKSDKEEFVTDVLLNNLIINLSSKIKALKYIIVAEKIEIKESDLFNALKITMLKRNLIAHSDRLLEARFDIIGLDADDNPEYGKIEPTITMYQDGKFNYQSINKNSTDFNKYYIIAFDLLNKVKELLGFEFYKNPFADENDCEE